MVNWASTKAQTRVRAPALLTGGPDLQFAELVRNGWEQLSDITLTLPAVHEFRSSLLPYCPILSLLASNFVQLKFGNDFYFASGHAQHNLYQKWLPYTDWGKNIWGDWYCLDCDSYVFQIPHPQTCPQCHSKNIIYIELEVSLRWRQALLTGHLDLVYKLPNGVVVIDIKTIRERRLDGSKLPYGDHLHQLHSYCYMFEKNFSIPVLGFALAYVPRELNNAGFSGDFAALPSAYFWGRRWDNKTRYLTEQRLQRALQGRNAELFIRKNGLDISAAKALTHHRYCHSARDYRDWRDSNMNRKCPHWSGEVCSMTAARLLNLPRTKELQ